VSKEKSPYNLKALALPVYIPSTLFAVAEGSLIPVIPAIAEKFGANLATAAIIVGLLMFGTLAMDLPAARFVNRFGERNSMITASLAAAAGMLFAVLAQNIIVLGIGVFIVGGAHGVFGLARHGYLTETVPFSHRARALSILGGIFSIDLTESVLNDDSCRI
jgi:predicted MFS family arabinose efflux permease